MLCSWDLKALFLTEIGWIGSEFKAWISCIHVHQWDIITHSCHTFNGGLAEPHLKSGYGWLITSHGNVIGNYWVMPEPILPDLSKIILDHYCDVIMGVMASQITSLTIVYSTICSGADQRKHQSSASLVFVWGIHRWPVNSPHKSPVTRKMFPFDDVAMSPQISMQQVHENAVASNTLDNWLSLSDHTN